MTLAMLPDCIEWQGARNSDGYGNQWFNGKCQKAHRVAWEEEHGPIPEGMILLHTCDNPPCINTQHLVLGTHKDNAQDRERKGRAHDRSAERNGRAQLSWDEVREIRRLYKAGTTQWQLATLFNVGKSTIHLITSGQTWKESDVSSVF